MRTGQLRGRLSALKLDGPQDGVLQCVAAHDGIVQGHDGILPPAHGAVVHVIGMHGEMLSRGILHVTRNFDAILVKTRQMYANVNHSSTI